MLWLDAASKSNVAFTVTTPVSVLMANLPPALSDKAYAIVLPASASVARAVSPTTAPTAAFSATVLPAALPSDTVLNGLPETTVVVTVFTLETADVRLALSVTPLSQDLTAAAAVPPAPA